MLTPDADLFPKMNRWTPERRAPRQPASRRRDHWDYTLARMPGTPGRSGRPVRARQAEVVRRQLGHANTQTVNSVYAQFRPNEEENERPGTTGRRNGTTKRGTA